MANLYGISGVQATSFQKPLATGAVTGNFQQLMRQSSVSAPNNLENLFSEMAERYGVPVDLLKAVAKTESNFQPDAVSSCGAMGIMQLMPETAKGLGVTNAFDPEQNIMGGAKYLGGLLKSYNGDVKLALAAYNAGSGNVAKYGGVPPFAETQAYIKRVMEYIGEDIDIPEINVSSSSGVQGQAASSEGDEFTYADYRLFVEMFFAQMNALQNGSSDSSYLRFLGL